MLVFDLDPGEGIAWDFVIETALRLRRMLKDEGLEPWPKLTGGKGLHLMAPLAPTIDHDQARAYAKRITGERAHEPLAERAALESELIEHESDQQSACIAGCRVLQKLAKLLRLGSP